MNYKILFKEALRVPFLNEYELSKPHIYFSILPVPCYVSANPAETINSLRFGLMIRKINTFGKGNKNKIVYQNFFSYIESCKYGWFEESNKEVMEALDLVYINPNFGWIKKANLKFYTNEKEI